MTLEKAHMLRCASALVIAAYTKSTPHASGFARLASESFYKASQMIKHSINVAVGKTAELCIALINC